MSIASQPGPGAARIPRATYRLQFNEHFRLADALALLPYLRELGISHVYASPLLQAMPHSTHGYDVCDCGKLNPEIGTEDELEQFVQALHAHGMGLVLDIVPNHMGIAGPENRWWWNVLTYGPASPFADYFDIDWKSPDPRLRGKIFLPVLRDHYERALERGKLQLAAENGVVVLRHFDLRLPLTPCSLPEDFFSAHGESSVTPAALAHLNAHPYALNNIVRQQYYVPACWREGDARLNYRRFFTITSLAGLRVEIPQVFDDTHALIRQWIQKGWLDGLRVDHPDGLRDPAAYLRRLRDLAPAAWIVVEKILQSDEALPTSWPVAGTTGYDFLNRLGGLFIDPNGESALTQFYADFTDETTDYAALVIEKKHFVADKMLAAEVHRLTGLLARVAERATRKFSSDELREAVVELAACFPVYRSYVQPETSAISEVDVAWINQAVVAARARRGDLNPELFNFMGDLLRLLPRGAAETDFVFRFQQLTVSAMAKGAEDTAFYCFNRLVALNEVGGDPGRFGGSVESFHEACRRGAESWPAAMLATATHDTKRGEDVRARISLLSEIPAAWERAVRRWSALNEPHRRDGSPDRNAEYLFYQTLVGAWPLSVERAQACLEKSAREAKQFTNWTQPNEAYETALRDFISTTLGNARFIRDLEDFLTPLIEAAYVNSLAQTLIKLTAPGVPDIYQGCELWDLSLVDPDNRQPVDFGLRQRLLDESKNLPVAEIWQRRAEGLPKLWLIRKVLEVRAQNAECFTASGGYEALSARGEKCGHLIAFMRGGNVITITQRLPLALKNDWANTTLDLPPGKWRNAFDGESVFEKSAPLAVLMRGFPVALLTRKERD